MSHIDVIACIRENGKWTPKLTPDEDQIFARLVPDLFLPVRGVLGFLKDSSLPPNYLVNIFLAVGFYLIFTWLYGFSIHGDEIPTPDVLIEHPIPVLFSAIGAAGLLFGPLWMLHIILMDLFRERVKSRSGDERLEFAKNILKIAQCYDHLRMADPKVLEHARNAGLDMSIVTRGIDDALNALKRGVTLIAELLVDDDQSNVTAAYWSIVSRDGLEKDLRELREAVNDLPNRVNRLIEERDRLIAEKKAADQLARRRSEVKEAAKEFTRK